MLLVKCFYVVIILICSENCIAINIFDAISEGINKLVNLYSEKDVFLPSNGNDSVKIPEDAFLNISQLVEKHGYSLEEHTVNTEDGYILSLHRLKSDNITKNGRVIFLMHGIIDSSDSWVLLGPENAFAYFLLRSGYDVWMGNARGNKYSLSHKSLTPNEQQFWNFTWEEIGLYDLPANIDYILEETNKSSLYYVGHSQGTTSFFVMCSLRPEYNRKVKLMFSFAPVAWMKNVKSPIVRLFSPANNILSALFYNLNTYSPNTDSFNKIFSKICALISPQSLSCENLIFMIAGDNKKLIDSDFMPVILGHLPSGSSVKQFVHYGQLVNSGRFCRFDYGEDRNLEIYGSKEPPEYDLSNVTVSIYLYFSGNDWLADSSDVNVLKEVLPNVYGYSYCDNYSHLDYLYSKMSKDLIYAKIVKQIDDFENM